MAETVQILHETGTYAALVAGGSTAPALVDKMLGFATDRNRIVIRSGSDYLQTVMTAVEGTDESVLYLNSDLHLAEDNANFSYSQTNSRLSVNNMQMSTYLYHVGDTDTYYRYPAANQIEIAAADNVMIFMDGDNNRLEARDSNVAHGMTTIGDTSAYYVRKEATADAGGIEIYGLTDNDGTNPLSLFAYAGGVSGGVDTYMSFAAAKNNGTGVQDMDAADIAFQFKNNATALASILGDGKTGIGVSDPDTKLEILYDGTQLKLSNDGTENCTFEVDTSGDLTITPSGSKIIVPDDTKLHFRDDDIFIQSANDGYLDIVADTAIRMSVIPAATTDTDKILVDDAGVLKFRTGAEIRSDIGALDATNGADNRIATFTDSDTLNGEANFTFNGSSLYLNGVFGIGAAPDNAQFELYQSGCPSVDYFEMRHADVTNPFTYYMSDDAFFQIDIDSETNGGAVIRGFSEYTSNAIPLRLDAMATNYCSGQPYMVFIAIANSGVGGTNIGDTEIGFEWRDYGQAVMRLYGDGDLIVTGDIATEQFTSYTPTISQSGDSTPPTYTLKHAKFKRVGKLVFVWATIQNSSGGTAGNGAHDITISTPTTMSSGHIDSGVGHVLGSGHAYNHTTFYDLNVQYNTNSTVSMFTLQNATYKMLVCDDQNNESRSIKIHFVYEEA